MNSRLRTATLLASLVLLCLIAALSFLWPATVPYLGSAADGGRRDPDPAHASASGMSQSPDIEPQGPVQREPVTQESSEDAGSHSRSSLPDDPGLRHFAYIADKALNDPEWGVKTFAETLGPGSVERSGHFNPDGISLEDYEIRELERLLEAHNTTIERTHRVHHAGVRQALARAILRGHSNLIAEGASHALLDEAIEDMSSG